MVNTSTNVKSLCWATCVCFYDDDDDDDDDDDNNNNNNKAFLNRIYISN